MQKKFMIIYYQKEHMIKLKKNFHYLRPNLFVAG